MAADGGAADPVWLQTRRLWLQPPQAVDLADSLRLWSDPAVVGPMGGQPLSAPMVRQRLQLRMAHWQRHGYGSWTVRERASGALVGELGFADYRRRLQPPQRLAPEASWVLRPAMQGQGLACEAMQAALSWAGRRWPGGELAALIPPSHMASIRLAQRLGFRCRALLQLQAKPLQLWSLQLPPTGLNPENESRCDGPARHRESVAAP